MGAQQTRKILVQDFNEKKLFSIYDVDKNPGESIPGGVGLLPFSIRKFGNGEMRFYVDGYQQNRPLLLSAVPHPTKNGIYLIKSFFDKTIGRLKRKRHAKYDSFQIFNKRRRAGEVRFFPTGSMTMTLPLGQGIFCMKSPSIFSMKDDHGQKLWDFFDINEYQFLLTCAAPFNWLQAFAFAVARILL